MNAVKIFWQFCRPHTIIGSLCSITALYILACAGKSMASHTGLYLPTLTAALCCNIFIVGLNQIQDVEMDKINKPYLPLAAGTLSKQSAVSIICITGFASLFLSLAVSVFLFLLISIILLVGVAYSLPPFKLKQHHLPAAVAITLVRGLLVNIGMFAHFNYEVNRQYYIPGYIWCITFFIMAFSIAIAWFKDLPDTEGDKKFDVKTLAVLYNKKTALYGGMFLVSTAYLYVLYWSAITKVNSAAFLFIAHSILFALFWANFFTVKLSDNLSVKKFYLRFWVFFFAEYLVFAWWILL